MNEFAQPRAKSYREIIAALAVVVETYADADDVVALHRHPT